MSRSRTAPLVFAILLLWSVTAGFAQEYPFHRFGTTDGLAQNSVTALAQDPRGFLWIGSPDEGVSRFDGKDFVIFDMHNAGVRSPVFALACDGAKRIFIGTGEGIRCIVLDPHSNDGPDSVMNMFLAAVGAPVHVLRFRSPGVLYAENADNAWLIDVSRKKIWPVPRDTTTSSENEIPIKDVQVKGRSRDGAGRMWYATDQGLVCMNGTECTRYDRRNGLDMDDVRSVLADREGNVWCGTPDGLFLFVPERNRNFTARTLLPPSSLGVTCIAETPGNGMWLGTMNGGAVYSRKDTSRILTMRDGLASNSVTCILVRSEEQVIFGTTAGLTLMDKSTLRTLTSRDGLPDDYIECILPSKFGGYWIGTRKGLVRWEQGSFRTFDTRDGLTSDRITQIAEDRYGDLWIGTQHGAYTISHLRMNAVVPLFNIINERISSVCIDNGNRPWFGTIGSGVYSLQQNGVIHITKEDNLAGNSVNFITQDNYGAMYFGTNAGISVIPDSRIEYFLPSEDRNYWSPPNSVETARMRAVSLFTLSTLQGLAGNAMGTGAVMRDSAGHLWFGSAEGVSRYTPMPPVIPGTWVPPESRIAGEVHQILIQDVRVDGRSVPITKELTLRSDNGSLSVHCILPSFRNPGGVKFYYLIDGLEHVWHESTDGKMLYSSLPPGSYRLFVRATIGEGVFTAGRTLLLITVERPFYQTSWSWLLIIVLAAGAGYWLSRSRNKRNLEKERTRTRIATEFYKDLSVAMKAAPQLSVQGQALPSGRADNSGQKGPPGFSAREAVSEMSDIVWAVNPSNDNGRALAQRLRALAESVSAESGIPVSCSCSNAVQLLSFEAEVRRNLVWIATDVLNHAVKHAACSGIDVMLEKHKRIIMLELRVHGRGYDPIGKFSGTGIPGMKSRARQIGWHLTVESFPGGASVLVTN